MVSRVRLRWGAGGRKGTACGQGTLHPRRLPEHASVNHEPDRSSERCGGAELYPGWELVLGEREETACRRGRSLLLTLAGLVPRQLLLGAYPEGG